MTLVLNTDVAVLGGGPAGCATAIALKQRGVNSVVIVEAGDYQRERVGEGIPTDTRKLLKRLQIWDEFLLESHDACLGTCSSWGSDQIRFNEVLFDPLGHGWHLDRRRFDVFMAEQAMHYGAELLRQSLFEGCMKTNDGYQLKIASDSKTSTLTSCFVVDATGSRSTFARRHGADPLFLDHLICVCGFFDLSRTAEFSRLAMLEAIEYGWWHAVRLPNDRVAIAVAADADYVRTAGLTTPNCWLRMLFETRHIGRGLAESTFISDSLLVCPAPSFVLNTVVGESWLAVGDAASAFDPISAQGIFNSLSNGLDAANVIVDHLSGNTESLGGYQAAVQDQFKRYIDLRNDFYGQETRWSQAPFWKQRTTSTATVQSRRSPTFGRLPPED